MTAKDIKELKFTYMPKVTFFSVSEKTVGWTRVKVRQFLGRIYLMCHTSLVFIYILSHLFTHSFILIHGSSNIWSYFTFFFLYLFMDLKPENSKSNNVNILANDFQLEYTCFSKPRKLSLTVLDEN